MSRLSSPLDSRPAMPAHRARYQRVTVAVLVAAGAAWLANAWWYRPAVEIPPQAAEHSPSVTTTAASAAPAARAFPPLPLSLAGIVTGVDPIALIRLGNEPHKAFTVGQEVAPGIRVSAIFADRAILRHEDQTKTLRLARTPDAAARAPVKTIDQSPRSPLFDPESLSTEETDSIEALVRDVRVAPNQGGGYYVQDVEAGSLYDKLGLQQGDIIYSLDSIRILKLEELARQNAVGETAQVTLEVMRNGQATILQYRFDDDNTEDNLR